MEVAYQENEGPQASEQANAPAEMMVETSEQITTEAEAIERIFHGSKVYSGIKVGCKEVIQAIEFKKAQFVVVATDVKEPAIMNVVEGLCKSNKIPVIKVDSSKSLGEWAGLCKTDCEGKARKIVGASCVAVTAYEPSSAAADFLDKKYQIRKKE